MKKVFTVVLALLLAFCVLPSCAFADAAFCANCGAALSEGMKFCPQCGTPLSSTDADMNKPLVSGAAGTGDLVYSFGGGDGIVVLEDAYVTVRLMSFYERPINRNGSTEIGKCLEIKVRNNSSDEYILNFERAYIGEDGVKVIMYDGNSGPVPGKTNTYHYCIEKETASGNPQLDSLEQLYDLEGSFALSIYNADKNMIIDRHTASLKLQDVFGSGTAPAASVAPGVQEISEALMGTWVLNGSNYFVFDGETLSIISGSNNLQGSYTVNLADSTIDALLQASNGKVSIHLPFSYSGEKLRLWNNQGVEMIKN